MLRTKAVANGALAHFVDHSVSARVSKNHYGVEVNVPFDPDVAEMKGRDVFKSKEGELRVDSAWHCIVAKVRTATLSVQRTDSHLHVQGAVIQAGQEFYQPYRMTWREDQTFFAHTSEIYVYRNDTPPTFLRNPGKRVGDHVSLVPSIPLQTLPLSRRVTRCNAPCTPTLRMPSMRLRLS
jgi:hypothetical protein